MLDKENLMSRFVATTLFGLIVVTIWIFSDVERHTEVTVLKTTASQTGTTVETDKGEFILPTTRFSEDLPTLEKGKKYVFTYKKALMTRVIEDVK